jgi:HlyD family secretion protein
VPEDKQLTIEAEITPKDIDQLALHTPARLRFTAFHQQTTPELMGHISKLSPDVSKNAQTGLTYYIATISLDEGQMEKLPNLALRPGMPVEAFISTSERTALSFLLKPIRDQLTRVFKEE